MTDDRGPFITGETLQGRCNRGYDRAVCADEKKPELNSTFAVRNYSMTFEIVEGFLAAEAAVKGLAGRRAEAADLLCMVGSAVRAGNAFHIERVLLVFGGQGMIAIKT